MKKNLILFAAVLLLPVCAFAQDCGPFMIGKSSSRTVEELIQGRISGLDVSSQTGSSISAVSTIIRGVNSLQTPSSPLWVVDGVIIADPFDVDDPLWDSGARVYSAPQNSFLGIDVNDIESVEILKDLSATAIYGSQGANGVIIINTRISKPLTSPLGLEWNSNVALSDGGYISHNHNASFSGTSGRTNYYVSGFYRSSDENDAESQRGGFRFNFNSKANSVLKLGLNASMSIVSADALNPLLSADADIDDHTGEYRTTDGCYVMFNPFRGFNLKADLGIDYRVKRRYYWYGPSVGPGIEKNGAASISTYADFCYNSSISASYNRYFGKSKVDLLVSAGAMGSSVNTKVMCGYNFFDYSLRSKGMSLASGTSTNRDNGWEETTLSGCFRARYDYGSIAGIEISARADRNSLSNLGFIVYPAVSVHTDILSILPDKLSWLSSLVMTAGWGKAGYDDYVPYLWMDRFTRNCPEVDANYQAFYNGFFSGMSSEWNLGLDASILDGRVNAAIKYYSKSTRESLRFYCKGEEFGTSGHWIFCSPEELFSECGAISNRGLELDLSADIIKNDDWHWIAALNAARNINVVVETPGLDSPVDPLCGLWTTSNIVSLPAHSLVGYELDESGYYRDLTTDGNITEVDMKYLASACPDFVFGLSTVLCYRRFTFDALVCGRIGASYFDYGAMIEDRSMPSTKYVRSADVVKPTRIALSYDVPLKSDSIGLDLSLSTINRMPCLGYSAFCQSASYLAGLRLRF